MDIQKQRKEILIKPVVTEKATASELLRKYTFRVSPSANKIEIKKAIQKLYKVTPTKINIIRVKGKTVRYGKTSGRTKNWKKATVTLKEGEKIDLSKKE